MNIQLTEELIRQRASEQSFQKGREYYDAGAIYDPAQERTPDGIVLTAHCQGSSAPAYRVRAVLDTGGVREAACTCPYDWGGDCKHIVALLLTYLHQPEEFSERKSVNELLSDLDKDELRALLTRLVQRDPDLYAELELAISAVRLSAQAKTAQGEAKGNAQVSEAAYRTQVKRVLKQNRYAEEEEYDEWDSAPAFLDDLAEIQQKAITFLDAGDAQGALTILRVLLEETLDDYDSELDYNGDVAAFIQDLGKPLAEAILSADVNGIARQEFQAWMEAAVDELDDVIEAGELEVALAALQYGWEALPEGEAQWDEPDEDVWMALDELQQARLNVLARQGRNDEFLRLAEEVDPYRFTLKLLELGQTEAAIAAGRKLVVAGQILGAAKALRAAGLLDEAVALAERGLDLGDRNIYELALWLAPLEEARGRTDLALRAYRRAFEANASIDLYRQVKRLAGPEWETLQPSLLGRVEAANRPDVLVDVYLEEGEWDAAIAQVETATFYSYSSLLESVAEAVIPHRPDWVIRLALKQSDELIARTQSNLYPQAAKWLLRAKKAYLHKRQAAEWQAYITNLRATYARRPALQREIAGL